MSPRKEVITVHHSKLHPNPNNPRYEAGDVTLLAKSITEEELLQPLLVIHAPEFGSGHFLIEDGYRRWTAARANDGYLDCIIRYRAPEESTALREVMTALITDEHKVPLNAIERARAYARLRDEFGLSPQEIANRLHLTRATIDRYLLLSQLSVKSQADVLAKKLPVDDAVRLVREHNRRDRKKQGKKPIEVGWDPEHFTDKHVLARKARTMCEARDHHSRRKIGKVACGPCWETVIRNDQTTVLRVEYEQAVAEGKGKTFQFLPAIMTPATNGSAPLVEENGTT